MLNPKLITLVAVFGFVLSFFAGLLAGVTIGILLLRAFISALLAGVLAAGVCVMYTKFLELSTDSFVEGSEDTVQTGGIVDITLGDDSLQEDESGPGFYVDPLVQKKAMSGSRSRGPDVHQSSSDPELSSLDTESVVINDELHSGATEKEEKSTEPSIGAVQNKVAEKGILDDELDELPDIIALSREITSSDERDESTRGGSPVHVENNTKDVNLMAQAIRTILTKDG